MVKPQPDPPMERERKNGQLRATMDTSDIFTRHIPSIVVLIVGIISSIIAFVIVSENETTRANTAFTTEAGVHADSISNAFSRIVFAIESVGALYDASVTVSQREFSSFTAPLLDRFPAIAALSWAPLVPHGERKSFEQGARKMFPGYRITERSAQGVMEDSAERQTYFPVYFLRPYAGNEITHGFDLYSNAIRRRAIDHARDSGKNSSTARISLGQEGARQYGLLLINPVFQNDSATDRGALKGLTSALFHIGNSMESALSNAHSTKLNVWLFDRSGKPDEQLLYFRSPGKKGAHQPDMQAIPSPTTAHYTHKFNFGDRNFELILSPEPGHFDISRGYPAWLALLIGLGFTVLLAAYLELVLRRSKELVAEHQDLEYQIHERKSAENQLHEANQYLAVMSREDPVMGIANRRHFDEYFQQEWKRAVRHGTSLSLLFGDIDHFKFYNDTYGHKAGDECLREIAQIATDALERPGDLAARYGGVEVAIVLPSTSGTGAHNIAEKIRMSVAARALPHEQSPVASVVTISIGCGTVVPTPGSSMEDFIQVVDAALYSAKHQGRNRTMMI